MHPSKKASKSAHTSRADLENPQANIVVNEGGSRSRAQAWTRTQNWSELIDSCLLSLLTEERTLGNNVNGTFTNLALVRIVSEFISRNNISLTKDQVKNRLKVMNRSFTLYHCLVNKSGWGWDYVLNIPTAGDSAD